MLPPKESKGPLDPRTCLLLTILYAGLIASSNQNAWLLLELGLIVVSTVAAGEMKQYAQWLRPVAVMTASWFIISLLAFDLRTALTASLRLVALTSAFFLFFRTTTPQDLGNALVKSGLPYEIAFVLSTSMQFVPLISRKIRNILDAQRARGIPLKPGFAALRHYPALAAPLLIQAFQLGEELAVAMESRGFGRQGRTFRRNYRMRVVDWISLGVAVVLVGTLIIVQPT
ncbi:MAG: energy-coupling factor transporter transmembrane component T [Chloroflexota bacterium]|nr:energy-coupling factor transporter transmembrane component T [Chloroflexota bacterium]